MSTPFLDEYHSRLKPGISDIDDHLEFLFESAKIQDGPVVEFGVRTGMSTSAFLAAIEGTDKELWSVDIDAPQVPAWWSDNPRWHFLQADDISLEAQQWLPTEIGLLFIDSSHSFQHTMRELRTYVPHVRKEGIVLLHDVRWLPPGQSLKDPGGPVKDALDQFCEDTGRIWRVRYGWDNGYGLGVLQP